MRTVDEMMQKFAEGHSVRPPYITARGSASEDVLLRLVPYGYFLVNPASAGDGTFCTMPASPGSTPHCLFEKFGLADIENRWHAPRAP